MAAPAINRGFANARTGETDRYLLATQRWDGSVLNARTADGVAYRPYNGLFYEKQKPEEVSFTDLGLIADGETPNQLALAAWQAKLPRGTTFVVPKRAKPFHFEALPPAFNNLGGTPTAIHIGMDGSHFRGENGGALSFGTGCVGIQVTGGLGSGDYTRLHDLVLVGPPRLAMVDGRVDFNGPTLQGGEPNPDAGLPIGSFSKRYEQYKFNGVNMWGKTELRNRLISGFTGHAVAIYGHWGVFAKGIPFPVAGKWVKETGCFFPDDPTMTAAIPPGFEVVLGSAVTVATGYTDAFVGVRDVPNLPKTGKLVALVAAFGAPLIADNCELSGGEIKDCGGSAVAVAGPDSNLLNLTNITLRNSGYVGVLDDSFLGIYPSKLHFTACGANFNIYPGDPEGRPVKMDVGPAVTRRSTAVTDWPQCYAEENMAAIWLGEMATAGRGGLLSTGFEGPGAWQQGNRISGWQCGPLTLDANGLSWKTGAPLRLGANEEGVVGFRYEKDTPQLGFMEAGAYLREVGGRDNVRRVDVPGVQVAALYVGTVGHFSTTNLEWFLQSAPRGMQLRAGDTFTPTRGGKPLTCTASGVLGLPELTGTVKPNGPTLRFSDAATLRPGDFVTADATTYEILRHAGENDYYVSPEPRFAGSFPVQWAVPAWA